MSRILAGALFLGSTVVPSHAENNSNYIFNGTTTNFGGNFTIGAGGGVSNTLEISNAGAVTNTSGILGNGSYNRAFVTNAGSMWINSGTLFIGHNAASARTNFLFIGDQGYVQSDAGAYVGHIGNYNNAIITDAGSAWTNTGTLTIGLTGGFNTFLVTNQAVVHSGATLVGSQNTSNILIVTGSGTIYTNTGNLNVGASSGGSGNYFFLLDGAQMHNVDSTVGGTASANTASNYVLVSGSNTLWNNTGRLTIGNLSVGNRLVISNGALVVTRNANTAQTSINIGSAVGSDDNLVTVTGAGSVLSNTAGIAVGNAGTRNQLTISDGGEVYGLFASIGNSGSGSGDNLLLITGNGSVMNLDGVAGSGLLMSGTGPSNRVVISDGGRLNNKDTHFGETLAGSNTILTVTGSGSVWSNSGSMYIGYRSPNNRVYVEDGGRVDSDTAYIGYLYTPPSTYIGTGNVVQVSGSNSTFNAKALLVGWDAPGNTLVVTNGGTVFVDAASPSVNSVAIGQHATAASNNTVIVTGMGSLWTNTGGITHGGLGGYNSIIVSDGGQVDATYVKVGVNAGAGRESNSVLITGANSTVNVSDGSGTGSFELGSATQGNSLVISNGGRLLVEGRAIVGLGDANNTAIVTGNGSLWQNGTTVRVSRAGSTIHVTDGGTLEATRWFSGVSGGGTISNVGGIYQFASASPTVTTTVDGGIFIDSGTISYRDVAAASIYNGQVSNITFSGNNTFRLNNSTNAALTSYTFDSVANTADPRQYQRLAMVNGGTAWDATGTTIGTGGALLASNTVGVVKGVVTNAGAITVVNSKMTYEGAVVISGSYVSDPSTNTYLDDVTVTQSGTLVGGVGDLFDFKKSLFINSTNNTGFQLHDSGVMFSGGGVHTNEITGADLGGSNVAYEAAFSYGTNFAYGELHLGATNDIICFLTGNGATSNALYVGWLDLLGSTNNVANLIAPTSINIYYAADNAANSYLGGLTYQLLDHNSELGGFLLPVIPEPSVATLLAACVFLLRRRSRRG